MSKKKTKKSKKVAKTHAADTPDQEAAEVEETAEDTPELEAKDAGNDTDDAASAEPNDPSENDSDNDSDGDASDNDLSDDDSSDDSSDDDASEDDASEDDAPAGKKKFSDKKPKPLVIPLTDAARKIRRRGAITFAIGGLTLFLLMAHSERLPHGTLFGLAALIVAVIGLLQMVGFLAEAPGATPWRETALGSLPGEASWTKPVIMVPIALGVLFFGIGIGGYDWLPFTILAALATLLPSALRRPGLMVFVVTAAIYAPLLGTFGLWDPWETHYGEVAREIVSRDDWISLWWAHENWFWSKPILIFWSESFWLSALGVDVMPDANPIHPEWAIRLPVLVFSLSAVVVVYNAIKRIFGTRAGMLSALCLATAPHFFLLSHQAITDMYLVSNVVMAVSLLALAITAPDDEESTHVRIFGLGVGLREMVLGGIAMLSLPQAFYLISRNLTFYPTEGFSLQGDTFLWGSGHNDGYDPATNEGVPGLARHAIQHPAVEAIWAQPMAQGLFWLALLGAVFFMLRKERRVQSLFMMAFYAFCALAFMGKTIPGIALPGMVALFYLIASKRWNLLYGGALKVAPGILVVLQIAMPWFVAMYMRHASGFTDRLLVHDNINRVAAGVHGDTGSIQYFIWQLGYGLFPWVGLVPAAVLAWVWMRTQTSSGAKLLGPYHSGLVTVDLEKRSKAQADVMLLFGLWFFATFTLFSAMITKFHHYIFPAVPPAVILSGILMDRFFGDTQASRKKRLTMTGLAFLAPLLLILGFGSFYGDLRGLVPDEVEGVLRQDWVLNEGFGTTAASLLVFAGAALFAYVARWFWLNRKDADRKATEHENQIDLSIAIAVGAGAVILAFVARDLSWVTSARPGGFERFIHLFVYNYGRPWPDYIDYRPILTGFGISAVALFVLLALRWTRAAAARSIISLALLLSAWCLNVYLPDLAPHWGMQNLFARYYEERAGPEEPVLAFQMNWKGENFYTGNRVYTFVDIDTTKIREWIDANRGKTVFVLTESGRLGSLRSLVHGAEVVPVTDERFNNKFMLVRIEGI